MLEIKTIFLCVCALNNTIWLDPNRTASRGTPQYIIKRNKINTIVGSASFSTLHEKNMFKLDLRESLDTFQHFFKRKKVSKLDAGKLLNSN